MLSGTLVPSFEVANSRVTSMSENETGEVLTSAVFFGSVWSGRLQTRRQARCNSCLGKGANHPPAPPIPARWRSPESGSWCRFSHRDQSGAPGTARLTSQRNKAPSPPAPVVARPPRSPGQSRRPSTAPVCRAANAAPCPAGRSRAKGDRVRYRARAAPTSLRH